MLRLIFGVVLLNLASTAALVSSPQWVIPPTSFSSESNFNTYWNYDYPWGTDHNGGARMNSSQVSVGNGSLILTATPVTGQPPTHGGTAIHYISGTVYAKPLFTVNVNSGYDFRGQFLAPTITGTWPAFWLTGEQSWPPEIDLAEWKGSDNVWFNSDGLDRTWQSYKDTYPNPASFHTIRVTVQDHNGVDVKIRFYLDGSLQTTQIGNGMVGAPFWL